MDLVVDASVLVGELTRMRGHLLIADERLTLYASQHVLSEVLHELPARLRARGRCQEQDPSWSERMYAACRVLISRHIAVIPTSVYESFEALARRRVPRDPRDWPTVALAMALEAGILDRRRRLPRLWPANLDDRGAAAGVRGVSEAVRWTSWLERGAS